MRPSGTRVLQVLALCLLVLILLTSCRRQGDSLTTLRAPLPEARMSAVAASTAGKLYFIGGITPDGCTSRVDEYDAAQNKWTQKSPIPTSRGSAAAVVLNGEIYVIGGRKDDDVLPVMEKYDSLTDKWTACSPMATPRWHLMAATVNGKIYAIGGIAGIGDKRTVLDVVEVYDPTTDRWTALPAMPVGNSNAGVTTVGTKIYIVGGRLRAGSTPGSASAQVSVYDTQSGMWDKAPSMHEERTGLEACTLAGKIYAVGGASRAKVRRSVEVFDLQQSQWRIINVLRQSRSDHNCVVLDNKIYILGGMSEASFDALLKTLEEYTPESPSNVP